jgi:hypothetical protein
MKLPCPNCKKTLSLDDTWAGKRIKCPACQETFVAGSQPSTAIAREPRPEKRPAAEEIEPVEEDIEERPRRRPASEREPSRVSNRDVRRGGLDVEDLRSIAIYQKVLLLCILAILGMYVALAVRNRVCVLVVSQAISDCHGNHSGNSGVGTLPWPDNASRNQWQGDQHPEKPRYPCRATRSADARYRGAQIAAQARTSLGTIGQAEVVAGLAVSLGTQTVPRGTLRGAPA